MGAAEVEEERECTRDCRGVPMKRGLLARPPGGTASAVASSSSASPSIPVASAAAAIDEDMVFASAAAAPAAEAIMLPRRFGDEFPLPPMLLPPPPLAEVLLLRAAAEDTSARAACASPLDVVPARDVLRTIRPAVRKGVRVAEGVVDGGGGVPRDAEAAAVLGERIVFLRLEGAVREGEAITPPSRLFCDSSTEASEV